MCVSLSLLHNLAGGKDVGAVYEIVFDEEFLGGLTLRCSPNRAYCLPPSFLLNISHGVRLKAERNAWRQPQNATHSQQSFVGGGGAGGQNFGPQRGSYSGVVMGGPPSMYGRDVPDSYAPVHYGRYQQHYNAPVSFDFPMASKYQIE